MAVDMLNHRLFHDPIHHKKFHEKKKQIHRSKAEKPQNGLAGLKHWRDDMLAGLQVSFIALPLSLGIALASGAPPVAGLISAIIAGIVYPLIGGSFVTISGPAAGLAPAVLAGVVTLGQGNLTNGYQLILGAIFLAGIIQVLLGVLGVGKIVRILPSSVVEGMLGAIGFSIMMQQLPKLVGYTGGPQKSVLESVKHVPLVLQHATPSIAILGVFLFLLLFILQYLKTHNKKFAFLHRIPIPLIIVIVGTVLSSVMHIDGRFLIHIPNNFFGNLRMPNFSFFNSPSLILLFIQLVITLALIDSTESLLTVSAVDRIDPYRRRSKLNRVLMAIGVSNITSGLLGGLTLIPEGVRSRANIEAGAKTLWSNTYASLFLLLYVVIGKGLINFIPVTALAALLMYIGWKLCEPRVWIHVAETGKDQLLMFLITFFAIIYTDLLTGVFIGAVCYFLFLFYILTPSVKDILIGNMNTKQFFRAIKKSLHELFGNPIHDIKMPKKLQKPKHPTYVLHLRSMTSFNMGRVEEALSKLPHHATVDIIFSPRTKIIDHSAMTYVHYVKDLWGKEVHDKIIIEGIQKFERFSHHPLSGAYNKSLLPKYDYEWKEADAHELYID